MKTLKKKLKKCKFLGSTPDLTKSETLGMQLGSVWVLPVHMPKFEDHAWMFMMHYYFVTNNF